VPTSALAAPGQIGRLTLKNRLFVAGHSTNLAVANLPTRRHAEYWGERARGGAALVITDPVRVHPNSAVRTLTVGGYTDDAVAGLSSVAGAVHAAGARAFAQLLHVGREAAQHRSVLAAWTPSAVTWSPGGAVAHVYSRADVRELVDAFAASARRVVRAGYDGLEIHAGHGHGLHQFLSPVANLRDDAYGGSAAGRLRVLREVLDAVLPVADGRPVGLRISADEFLAGGLNPELMTELVGMLITEYPLGFLHVSHSAVVSGYSLSTQIADMAFGPAPFRHFPAHFKHAFPELPVLAVCRMDDQAIAETLIADGAADFVGFARAAIADPQIVTKWLYGQAAAVRPCIACNECIGRVGDGLTIGCVVNPEAGREAAWRVLRAAPRDHPGRVPVTVIGGGVAGMSAAAEAARAGHPVTLLEATGRLGGLAATAAAMRNRRRIGLLVDHLAGQCARAGVTIRLDTVGEAPAGDAVIVATGARPAPPPPWAAGLDYLTPAQAVTRPAEAGAGRGVVVVDEDGGWEGAGVAEDLALAGYRVRIVSRLGSVGWRIVASARAGLIDRLGRLGVEADLACQVVGAADGGLRIRPDLSAADRFLPGVDLVVHARPLAAPDPAAFGTAVSSVAGDARAPRGLLQAVYDGQLAGATIGVRAADIPFILASEM
jgi:2,4-dienoyl-CoA reductase-like NADH-dependent reductase (Old Yellow Enzyme family)